VAPSTSGSKPAGPRPGYAAFDAALAQGMKTMQGLTAEEMTTLQKFATEGMINAETNRDRLSAAMSYVDQATKAKDPASWAPKK
jgi:hypothetical protein